MSKIKGMRSSVHFGAVDAPLPDWRDAIGDEDADDELIDTPSDVVAVLGFDPADEAEDDEGILLNCGTGAGGFKIDNTCAAGGDGDREIAHGIVEALEAGGFSYQPIEGSSPIIGYAVSPFKGKELVRDSADAMSEDDVLKYMVVAREAAQSDNRVHVGGWVDDRDGKAYLDLSVVVTDQAEAERVALDNDQEAYYDIAKKQTVYTKKRGNAGQNLAYGDGRRIAGAGEGTSQQNLQAAAEQFSEAAIILNCGAPKPSPGAPE